MTNYIDGIQDPLKYKHNINRYVAVFSNTNKDSFSKVLLSKSYNAQKHEDVLKKNKEDYYLFLLEQWMNFVANISMEQFSFLKEKGVLDDRFLMLQKQVQNFLNTNSLKEAYILFQNRQSPFSQLAAKYGFDPSNQNDWQKVSSYFFLDFRKQQEYFLSLNCKSYDLLKICRLFQKQCITERIPCHYQFHTTSSTIDNLIIWSDEEHLSHYLDILNHLQTKYPNLFSRCGKNSSITATILPHVGLGVSNMQTLEEYYSSRTNHIRDSIQEILWSYVSSHYNQKQFNQQTLINFLAEQITSEYIKEVNLSFLNPNQKYQDFRKKYHFFIRDINKKEFYQTMVSKVRSNLIKQFQLGHQNKTMEDIQFSYRFGWDRSYHTVSKELICHTIEKNATKIFQSNPTLYQQLCSYLKVSASSYGISDEYCTQLHFQEKKTLQKRK